MKLDFKRQDDNGYHQYCINCHAETVRRISTNRKTMYSCSTCGNINARSVVIDSTINWWVDDDNEYWHESAGVFIAAPDHRFLFFERIIFPFAFTVPSGHVDKGEDPSKAAVREVVEEVGITLDNLRLIATEDVWGDKCRRGADVHRWHAYVGNVGDNSEVRVNHEGYRACWITLEEALEKELIVPVRFMIEKYKNRITSREAENYLR